MFTSSHRQLPPYKCELSRASRLTKVREMLTLRWRGLSSFIYVSVFPFSRGNLESLPSTAPTRTRPSSGDHNEAVLPAVLCPRTKDKTVANSGRFPPSLIRAAVPLKASVLPGSWATHAGGRAVTMRALRGLVGGMHEHGSLGACWLCSRTAWRVARRSADTGSASASAGPHPRAVFPRPLCFASRKRDRPGVGVCSVNQPLTQPPARPITCTRAHSIKRIMGYTTADSHQIWSRKMRPPCSH